MYESLSGLPGVEKVMSKKFGEVSENLYLEAEKVAEAEDSGDGPDYDDYYGSPSSLEIDTRSLFNDL